MVENQRILTGSVLPLDMLPTINAIYFRFEAFGDLNNDIQVINYFNMCYKNPRVKFALWTKNPDFIEAAIAQGYAKPENLNIVLSSLFINKERKKNCNVCFLFFLIVKIEINQYIIKRMFYKTISNKLGELRNPFKLLVNCL